MEPQEVQSEVEAEVIRLPVSQPEAEEPSVGGELVEVVQGEIVEDEAQSAPLQASAVHPPKSDIELRSSVRALAMRGREVARRPDRLAVEVLRHELVYGSIGTARGLGRVWRWMTAAELEAHLASNPKMVLDARRARRRAAAVAGTGVGAAGVAAWVLLAPAVPLLAIALVLAVAGVTERRRQAVGDAEAGRAALGPSPSGKAVRRALSAAKLGKVEDLRVLGPVTRTEAAWEATIELPAGTTYKHATKRRGEVAAAIGVDEVQVALDPVKGHNGRVKVWVADEDPMQGARVVNPLTQHRDQRVNFWRDKLFAGRDARGRPVSFSMVERSYLIGGEPGGGKSVASNNVLSHFFLDPNVKVFQADGKFGFDLMLWESMAADALTDRDPKAMLPFLGDNVQSEMDRRYALLRKIGAPKVTEEIARRYDMHPILVHIDEIQYWTAGPDKKTNDAIMVLIADIVGRGRAAGIITGVVTQRPAAEVVPTRLRDILSIRWALRCTTPAASDTILGTGWAGRGYSAALFEPDQRGAGYLLAEGSTPIQTRSAFIDPDKGELDALAKRAYALRQAAGTLPATAYETETRLLTAVLDAMDHPKGAHTSILLERLARDEAFAGWDASQLARALKPLGVESKQLNLDGTNRNGYARDTVQAALERL